MRSNESGFTLVAYLTASAATMVIMAATFQMLNMTFSSNTGMVEVMSTQQNIRVGINTIARDITMAGTGLPTGGISVPNGANAQAIVRPGIGGSMLTPDNTIAIITPGNEIGPSVVTVTPTDALTVTAMNQDSPLWTVNEMAADGDEILFNEDIQDDADFLLEEGDVLVFSNANGRVFGVVTSISEIEDDFRAFFADTDPLNLNQPEAEAGNIKALFNEDATLPPTTATKANIVTYYLNNDVQGHPRLMRALNGQAAQVIVEDVENLEFSFDLFDFEANEDSSNEEDTLSPNQIRSVHVVLNGRSSKVLQRTNNYYRFSLASKVNVRNATFRNRFTG